MLSHLWEIYVPKRQLDIEEKNMGANQRDCTKYVIFRDIDGATDLFSMGLEPSIPCL
jgi:hypothetical protein